jgi:hypothetical protein
MCGHARKGSEPFVKVEPRLRWQNGFILCLLGFAVVGTVFACAPSGANGPTKVEASSKGQCLPSAHTRGLSAVRMCSNGQRWSQSASVGSATANVLSMTARSCRAMGLSGIPIRIHLYVRRVGLFVPVIRIRWRGEPLPVGCKARRRVAVDVRVWFANVSGPVDVGPPESGVWPVFWEGRKVAKNDAIVFRGVNFSEPLGCIRKVQGWLRYSVVGSNPRVHAAKTVPTKVGFFHCR